MSSLPQYSVFNKVARLTENTLINELEENMKAFLDWGFLNIGGFVNVTIPSSGLYGGTFQDKFGNLLKKIGFGRVVFIILME